jgi:hypothetical protein
VGIPTKEEGSFLWVSENVAQDEAHAASVRSEGAEDFRLPPKTVVANAIDEAGQMFINTNTHTYGYDN